MSTDHLVFLHVLCACVFVMAEMGYGTDGEVRGQLCKRMASFRVYVSSRDQTQLTRPPTEWKGKGVAGDRTKESQVSHYHYKLIKCKCT